jgi:hypothetical protein
MASKLIVFLYFMLVMTTMDTGRQAARQPASAVASALGVRVVRRMGENT